MSPSPRALIRATVRTGVTCAAASLTAIASLPAIFSLPAIACIVAPASLGACASDRSARTDEGGGAAPGGAPDSREAEGGDRSGDSRGGDRPGAGGAREVAPGLEILSSEAPGGSVRAEDLLPAAGARQEWTVLMPTGGGSAPAHPFVIAATAGTRYGAEMELAEGPDQTLYLVGVAAGSPAMVATLSKRDDAVSRFEPPLAMATPQLSGTQTVQGSAAMVVVSARESTRKPPEEKDRGVAARRLSYAADETLRGPFGEVRCQRIEIEFDADLRFADATIRTVRWIVPGVGAIAEDRRERIVVMGLIPSERRRVIVRDGPWGFDRP